MKFASTMQSLLLGCSIAALASPALAQSAGNDDIVVTAQNRSENVQDVPISIDVFSSQDLADAGVSDLNTLQRIAPDIGITNDTVFTRVAVRGIGTNSNDEAQDQSLTINIDGEYINRPISLNAAMFDLERVEILRGPQGTLYGRNATGGALNIIAAKPTQEFGASGSIGFGNFDAVNFEGALNVPLGDRAAVRFAAMGASHEGYTYHPNLGQSSDDQGVLAARIGVQLDPTDNLSIYLAAEHVNVDQTAVPEAWANLNAAPNQAGAACSGAGWSSVNPPTNTLCIPNGTNLLGSVDRHEFNAAGIGSFNSEQTAYRAQVAYDFGGVTLTYRGGYRDSQTSAQQPLPPAYVFYNDQLDSETTSHELRLNGGQEGGIIWQTGVFFFNEDQYVARGLYTPFAGANGSLINYFYRPDVNAESRAVFGQVDIPLGETLTAVFGARYTEDEKSATFINYGFQFNSGPNPPVLGVTPPSPTLNVAQSYESEKTTWSAGLNWEPSDDMLVYGRVSTGYKAGGFDSVGPYAPETLTAYEIGSKNQFADGRVTFNVDAFYYDYTDLQVAVLLDTSIGAQVFNAGEATIWGVEANLDTWLTDSDRLSLSANYLNAEYVELAASSPVQCLGGCGTTAYAADLSGNTPTQSPELVLTLGYDHIWTLNSGSTVTASLFSRYKSDYYLTIFNYNDDTQEAFTQTDASLEFAHGSGNWRLQAFVRNIEDIRPLTFAGYTAAASDDIYGWTFGAPRTYGAKLSVDF